MSQEKSKSFLTELSKEDKFLYKVTGTDTKNNRKAWWIIRILPEKLTIFSAIINKGNLNLEEYGEILDSGFAESPPKNILEKYGFAV